MKTAKEINEDLDYLFGKINWKTSWLDAEAIFIMNNLRKDIYDLEASSSSSSSSDITPSH